MRYAVRWKSTPEFPVCDAWLSRRWREHPVTKKIVRKWDFEPGKIAQQVPALRKLLDARNKLRDLLAKADRSEDLESLLEGVLQNDEQLKRLAREIEAGKETD